MNGPTTRPARPIGIEVFYWLDNWSDDQTSVFARAAECGFDCVEISFVAGLQPDIGRIASLAADHGLSVLASTGLAANLDITSPDAEVRRAGRDHLRRCIEWAADLGSPILGGVTYAQWMGFPDDDLAARRSRSAEELATVAPFADEHDVDICLEVLNRFETYMFNTVADALGFIDVIGHDRVKVELDTFHMSMEEADLVDSVRRGGQRIGHVQVASNDRRAPQYSTIDWAAFAAALDDADYRGAVVFETFPNPNVETGRGTYAWRPLTDDPDGDASKAAAMMREVMS